MFVERRGGPVILLEHLHDGEAAAVLEGADDLAFGSVENNVGKPHLEVEAFGVLPQTALAGEGACGVRDDGFREIGARPDLGGELLGEGQLGLGRGGRIFGIAGRDVDLAESDPVLRAVAEILAALAVTCGDFRLGGGSDVLELLLAEGLHQDLLLLGLAELPAVHSGLLEVLPELLLAPVEHLADDAVFFLDDDLLRKLGVKLLELAEDELVVDEPLEHLVAGLFEGFSKLVALAGVLGAEEADGRGEVEGYFLGSDGLSVDGCRDAVQFDRGGKRQRCQHAGQEDKWLHIRCRASSHSTASLSIVFGWEDLKRGKCRSSSMI